jgi:hypothetical protein
MENIGTQVSLPFSRAFQIALQGIRNRLGRSLVTMSGVMLGIAFLMCTITTQLIDKTVNRERKLRQTVNLMENVLKSEIGAVQGKRIAVAAFGAISESERTLIASIVAAGPVELRGYGVEAAGVTRSGAKDLAADASVVLIFGDSKQCPLSLAELTACMTRKLALDTRADRAFTGTPDPSIRRELFFGKQIEEQASKQRIEAQRERSRLIWIVAVSLCVTVIGVANAMLMSVTERFREIGTMKCLGALSGFIRTLFLIESALIGFTGSVVGAVSGALFTMLVYSFTYSFATVFLSMPYDRLVLAGMTAVVIGTILAMLAALYPARVASRMVPASALRSTV